jgi:hypothetical protein
MKIKDIALRAAYVGQMVVKAICVGAQEVWSAVKYIVFKDPVVEQICATNWGDGVGITEEQAAAVREIGQVFRGRQDIKTFDEFQFFTGIEELGTAGMAYNEIEGSSIFTGSSLESIVIPNSVKIIGDKTFSNCANLSVIHIPESVTHIGWGSFNMTPCKLALNLPNLEDILPQSNESRVCTAFYKSGVLRIDNIGKVKELRGGYGSDYGVFSGCEELTYANIENVKNIRKFAFKGCSKLKRIVMKSAITYGERAFENCTSLVTADIPETTTGMGWVTFAGCSNLKTVILRNPTPFGEAMIVDGTSANVYVPDSSLSAYRSASGWVGFPRLFPFSLIEGLRLYPESGDVGQITQLSSLFDGQDIDAVYETDSSNVIIDNGVMSFIKDGSVNVTASYNEKRISKTYIYIKSSPIDITGSMEINKAYVTNLSVGDTFTGQVVDSSYTQGARTIIQYVADAAGVRLTGLGGTSPRLYCFLDNSDRVITVADAGREADNETFYKPLGAVKVVVTFVAASVNPKLELLQYEN